MPPPLDSLMTRSTTTSRGGRDPRVRGRWGVRPEFDRRGGERLGDWERRGERHGDLSPDPSPVSSFLSDGVRPLGAGDTMAHGASKEAGSALIPNVSKLPTCLTSGEVAVARQEHNPNSTREHLEHGGLVLPISATFSVYLYYLSKGNYNGLNAHDPWHDLSSCAIPHRT